MREEIFLFPSSEGRQVYRMLKTNRNLRAYLFPKKKKKKRKCEEGAPVHTVHTYMRAGFFPSECGNVFVGGGGNFGNVRPLRRERRPSRIQHTNV